MSTLFRNKWALVTGASSGLGAEFARQLASKGSNLVLTARSGDRLEALSAELCSSFGIGTRVLPRDLAAVGGAAALLEDIEGLGVGIDHLVGNAGFGSYGVFPDMDRSSQTGMIRLNCEALVELTHGLLPGMLASGRGGVLHVASTAGFQATPLFATYGATKAFVLHFTEALAEELRGTGVRVMALCPGPVLTGFQQRANMEIPAAQQAAVLSASETVRRGLAAYEQDTRGAYVPGAVNKVGAVLSAFAPRSLVARFTHKIMSER